MGITGATGFIGRHLATHLARGDADVRCLVRDGPRPELRGLEVTQVEGDVRDLRACQSLVAGTDVVFHLAGLGLTRFHQAPEVNVLGTHNVVEACLARGAGVRTLVFMSSIKAGSPCRRGEITRETDPPRPTDAYGRSKHHAELLVKRARGSLRALTVRPPLVYGPGDSNLRPLLKARSLGLLPLMGNGGGPRQSAVYVTDLVAAMTSVALDRQGDSDTLHLAHPEPTRWNEVMRALARVDDRPVRFLSLPTPFLRGSAGLFATGLRSVGLGHRFPRDRVRDIFDLEWVCATDRARDVYGITCPTHLDRGLKHTWAAERGLL